MSYTVYSTAYDSVARCEDVVAAMSDVERSDWLDMCASSAEKIRNWITSAEPEGEASRTVGTGDVAVVLLVDHSGSLRGERAILSCAIMQFVSALLFRHGIVHEVLGFTTSSWKGGQSRQDWLRTRSPNPGRLCDLLHIIYRSFDEDAPLVSETAQTILFQDLLKENVDGEAVLWARERLEARPEARKLILVLSDGAPVDDSTLAANDEGYLHRHLVKVIEDCENSHIEIAGIGLSEDVLRYYSQHICLSEDCSLNQRLPDFLSGFLAGQNGP